MASTTIVQNQTKHMLRFKVELVCEGVPLYVDLPLLLAPGCSEDITTLAPMAAAFLRLYRRRFPDLTFTRAEIVWR